MAFAKSRKPPAKALNLPKRAASIAKQLRGLALNNTEKQARIGLVVTMWGRILLFLCAV
jgi:hypothetical protein